MIACVLTVLAYGGSWADDDIDMASISVPIERGASKSSGYNSSYGSSAFNYGSRNRQSATYDNGPPYIVKLTNLPVTCDDAFIEDLFQSRYTRFVKFKIVVDPVLGILETHIIKKVAFVELCNFADLNKVIKWLDLYYSGSRRVVIDLADFDDFQYCIQFNQKHESEIEQIEKEAAAGRRGFPRDGGYGSRYTNGAHPNGFGKPSQPSKPPAPPKPKANPFGAAKPVDTVEIQKELEMKYELLHPKGRRQLATLLKHDVAPENVYNMSGKSLAELLSSEPDKQIKKKVTETPKSHKPVILKKKVRSEEEDEEEDEKVEKEKVDEKNAEKSPKEKENIEQKKAEDANGEREKDEGKIIHEKSVKLGKEILVEKSTPQPTKEEKQTKEETSILHTENGKPQKNVEQDTTSNTQPQTLNKSQESKPPHRSRNGRGEKTERNTSISEKEAIPNESADGKENGANSVERPNTKEGTTNTGERPHGKRRTDRRRNIKPPIERSGVPVAPPEENRPDFKKQFSEMMSKSESARNSPRDKLRRRGRGSRSHEKEHAIREGPKDGHKQGENIHKFKTPEQTNDTTPKTANSELKELHSSKETLKDLIDNPSPDHKKNSQANHKPERSRNHKADALLNALEILPEEMTFKSSRRGGGRLRGRGRGGRRNSFAPTENKEGPTV